MSRQSFISHQIMLSAAVTFCLERCADVVVLVVFVSTVRGQNTPLDRRKRSG